jgi:YHS domain-containing protein
MDTTLVAAVCSVLIAASPAPAQTPARDVARYCVESGPEGALALRGFDPVALFPEGGGAASEGVAAWTTSERGVLYRFASEEHRAWFRAEPARYEPAHGGWCSRAMAEGQRVAADPRQSVVQQGRVFLFASADARAQWLADPALPALVGAADARWKEHSGEDPRGVPGPGELDPPQAVYNNLEKGLALGGYDAVSYFPEGGGKPAKGEKAIELELDGVRYRFASEAHKQLFAAQPERYRPRYGGWCAYAMAQGEKVEVDPKSFLVNDGRLFLFYQGLLNDTRKKWLKEPADLEGKANREWLALTTRGKG